MTEMKTNLLSPRIVLYVTMYSLLQMDPLRSEVFRGLGGAYQSMGQHQMAFASYQQAINVTPSDLLAYLKLGMLYEELVRMTVDPSLVTSARIIDRWNCCNYSVGSDIKY